MQSLVGVLNSAHAVRAGVSFSISQPGDDAVLPDTAEKRHSLLLQACPDRLTVKATPAAYSPSVY